MSHAQLGIGLLGFGVVGQGVYQLISQHQLMFQSRTGASIEVKSILVRDTTKSRQVSPSCVITDDFDAILANDEVHVVVELMGGEEPALTYISAALKAGKSVVTANKELIAKHHVRLSKLAAENGVDLYFEPAVAGGIPLIRSLKIGYGANQITSLFGILNGTTNYILTKIKEEQRSFGDVLKTAQELGFAEADPTMDVTGLDAAYKLVILAACAFKVHVSIDDIFYEGIEAITLQDILYADELGYTIKLLANGTLSEDGVHSFSVCPTLISNDHPLASVSNEMNAVYLEGDFVGEAMLYGKGAGSHPTASAVVSDVLDLAFGVSQSVTKRNLEIVESKPSLAPFEECLFHYYLRLVVPDTKGILESVTHVLSDHDASIYKIRQKPLDGNRVELIIVTHDVKEGSFQSAIEELRSSEAVLEIASVIRAQ